MIRIFKTYAILPVLFWACNAPAPRYNDTNTSGTITISADESLKPIIDAEKEVFTTLYPDAHINVIYTNESEAIDLLTSDSVRIAITSRDLLPEERALFEKRKIYPKSITIGYDAIALILHPSRTDTTFTLSQLTGLLNGSIKTWKDLGGSGKADEIRIVFDNGRSGAVRHLRDSLLGGAGLAPRCYAVNSNPEVIGQVEKDPNTIGIIGVSWISDRDDTLTRGFLKRVKVAGIVPRNPETAEARVMKPYQGYIALKQYPLYRTICIINPEGRYGLGTGFSSFINSHKGQLIILKSGLVPANAPVRLVELK